MGAALASSGEALDLMLLLLSHRTAPQDKESEVLNVNCVKIGKPCIPDKATSPPRG